MPKLIQINDLIEILNDVTGICFSENELNKIHFKLLKYKPIFNKPKIIKYLKVTEKNQDFVANFFNKANTSLYIKKIDFIPNKSK